jgi:hypothetical protein
MTMKFITITIFAVALSLSVSLFLVKLMGMYIISFHAKFKMPISVVLLVIIIRLTANYKLKENTVMFNDL